LGFGSWVTRTLGGNRLKISAEAEDSVYANSVRNAAFDRSEVDEAYRKSLAIFSEAVHDEGVERILSEKMLDPVRVALRDGDGGLLYVKDAEGNVVLDEAGRPEVMFKEYTQINNFYAAIYNMQSHVNRLSHINASDARIHYWYAEDIMSDIIMGSHRRQLNSGEIAYMKSWLTNVHIMLQDATNGRKLDALLTVKREASQKVAVGPVENKSKVF